VASQSLLVFPSSVSGLAAVAIRDAEHVQPDDTMPGRMVHLTAAQLRAVAEHMLRIAAKLDGVPVPVEQRGRLKDRLTRVLPTKKRGRQINLD